MKIDLHLHTKKMTSGETEKRNIDPKSFKNKLIDSNVGIAAITNHYYFDKDQYNKMSSNKYILLPGVELNIDINNKVSQANVIAHPNDIDYLCEKLALIKNDKENLSYESFLKYFNKKKWIISLDYKNSGNTKWELKYMKQAIDDFDKAFVISDTNKATTLRILHSHSFNAFIGSDICDWDKYEQVSQKLVDTKLNIENYDKFWSLLKFQSNDLDSLFKHIDERTFDHIVMNDSTPKNQEDYVIDSLCISSGVNIIFGAKRTGKTEILKNIKEKVGNDGVFYESSNKENDIADLETKLFDKSLFSSKKNEWNDLIKKAKKYKESKFTKFSDFFHSIKEDVVIKFHVNISTNVTDPKMMPNINKQIELINELLKNINDASKNIELLKMKNNDWEKGSINILGQLCRLYKEYYKEYWKQKIDKEIKKRVDVLMRKNKGIKPRPGKIGLFDRFHEKQKFLNTIDSMKKFTKEKTKDIEYFKIPGRLEVKATQFIFFIDFWNKKNINQFYGKKNKILEITKHLKEINKSSFSLDFVTLKDSFVNFSDNNEPFYKEYVKINDFKNNETFSNGEKAHLLLQNVLSNNDVDYYILDEPGLFLSKESLTDFLLPKISKLVIENKKIIISTHNSSIGLNTIPIKYIYRKYGNANDECETYVGRILDNSFINIKNKDDNLDFSKEIIEVFEGSEKHFNFRKDIYENKL